MPVLPGSAGKIVSIDSIWWLVDCVASSASVDGCSLQCYKDTPACDTLPPCSATTSCILEGSVEIDDLASENISSCQTTEQIAAISTSHDGDRPFLPLAVPIQQSAIYPTNHIPNTQTDQSRGIGTAPSHAPIRVPSAAPKGSSMGMLAERISLHFSRSPPWT